MHHNLKYLLLAIVAALTLSAVMTGIDIWVNPAGLFVSDRHWHWSEIFETFLSWFLPAGVFFFLLIAALAYFWQRLNPRTTDSLSDNE